MTLSTYQEALEQEILSTQYGEQPTELYEPIRYLMALGGKRIRPALTLIGASLWTDQWQSFLKPALAVEVFHNFTLMHDDIMDEAPLRRGQPTVHQKWNTNTAILSGDVMLVAAYDLLTDVPDAVFKSVIKRFNRTAAEVCEGQQWDMNFASLDTVSIEQYTEMIRLKTSVLIGFALELGGMLVQAPTKDVQALYDLGISMGLGFQLKDDVLDVYGDPEKFGKQVGGDILENKKTWLMIQALHRGKNTPAGAELLHWLTVQDQPEVKVQEVTRIFTDLGIKDLAEAQVDAYFDQARQGIDQLDVPASRKKPLFDLANMLHQREK